MGKPRIIIADEDTGYIIPLQYKFITEFHDEIELEIITSRGFFDELFSKSQSLDILIISDALFEESLKRHSISNVFVMTESHMEGGQNGFDINYLFKYSSVKAIFNEILSKSGDIFKSSASENKQTQIILVTSAAGGMGCTTVSMGLSSYFSKNYKNVLYINASRLQSFNYLFKNDTPIAGNEIYSLFTNPTENVYEDIKHTVRKEEFSYLPEFKASLMSLGIDCSIYEKLALSAKKSGEYDFVILDCESTFDEYKSSLLNISDRVYLVLNQDLHSVMATNSFISNISGTNSEKYIFLCNRFDRNSYNAILDEKYYKKFAVNEYIPNMEDSLKSSDEFNKAAFLVM